MTAHDTLWHLTTTSGHGRWSPRSEVGEDIIRQLRPLIRDGGGELQGLTITIGGDRDGGCAFSLGWDWDPRDPDVRCVLCWDPARHDAWRRAADTTEWMSIRNFEEPPHGCKWLAVALQPRIMLDSFTNVWQLGDAERCVAWAIIEDERERQKPLARTEETESGQRD